jgi:hypothetical protein
MERCYLSALCFISENTEKLLMKFTQILQGEFKFSPYQSHIVLPECGDQI